MVFSSLPYMDPANWNQQHGTDQQQGINITNSDSLHFISQPDSQPQPHLLSPPQQGQVLQLSTSTGCGPGSIRPGSMVDRARLARLPLPEAGLKCPRCESTNTKFCYFNNYSLTQPRHFCKACRRYWTRGGALRSVPVGGGCRRNKRSKSTGSGSGRSKSPMTIPKRATTSGGINSSSTNVFSGMKNLINSNSNLLPPSTQLPSFFPALQNLNDYETGDFGLNMGTFSTPTVEGGGSGTMRFQMGLGSSSSGMISRVQQQFPFLSGLDSTPNGLYTYPQPHSDQGGVHVEQSMGSNGMQHKYHGDLNSEPCVKREDHNQLGLGTSKNQLGIIQGHEAAGATNHGHDQYNNWQNAAATGNEWPPPTDLSALNNSSSSTSHLI